MHVMRITARTRHSLLWLVRKIHHPLHVYLHGAQKRHHCRTASKPHRTQMYLTQRTCTQAHSQHGQHSAHQQSGGTHMHCQVPQSCMWEAIRSPTHVQRQPGQNLHGQMSCVQPHLPAITWHMQEMHQPIIQMQLRKTGTCPGSVATLSHKVSSTHVQISLHHPQRQTGQCRILSASQLHYVQVCIFSQ